MRLEQKDTTMEDLVDRPVVKVNPIFTREFRNFEVTLKDGLSLSYSFIQKWNELVEVSDIIGLVCLIIDLKNELASVGIELCLPYHFGQGLKYLYEVDTLTGKSVTSEGFIARCEKVNSIAMNNPTPQFTIITEGDTNYILYSRNNCCAGYADFTLYTDIESYKYEKEN